jgi:hypothetical protein
MITIKTTAKSGAAAFDRITNALVRRRIEFFRQIGAVEAEVVRRRIQSQDDGRWAKASKWVRAKKALDQPLFGAERFVKLRVTANEARVYGNTGDDAWTLTQHDRGFYNALVGKKDEMEGDRVVLKLRDPSALGRPLRALKKGRVQTSKFFFVPKRIGHTPARKIWSEAAEVQKRMTPIAVRWIEKVTQEAVQ